MKLFVDASIPSGPVNTMQSLFADPQVLHRNMLVEMPHRTIGTLRMAGIPVKYSETPGTVRLPPPLLGEHTDEVLTELGLDADAISRVLATPGVGLSIASSIWSQAPSSPSAAIAAAAASSKGRPASASASRIAQLPRSTRAGSADRARLCPRPRFTSPRRSAPVLRVT